jgi:hypothetical protein
MIKCVKPPERPRSTDEAPFRKSAFAFPSGGKSGGLAPARLNAVNIRFKARLP